MEAIILAGGRGTRLKSIVTDVPKPMAIVAGRPFLEIVLTLLANKGFQRVILSLGYMADKVVSYFGKRFSGMELVYEVEKFPLGTGGATRMGMKHCTTDHIFVFNGDTYIDLEVSGLENQWKKRHNPIVVARKVQDVSRYGHLKISDDRIVGFSEKNRTGEGLINAGCYLLPTGFLDKYGYGQPFSLEIDFLSEAVKERDIDFFKTDGKFIDIGVPKDYKKAQIELSKILAKCPNS